MLGSNSRMHLVRVFFGSTKDSRPMPLDFQVSKIAARRKPSGTCPGELPNHRTACAVPLNRVPVRSRSAFRTEVAAAWIQQGTGLPSAIGWKFGLSAIRVEPCVE
jgi:hypothetical protein